MQALLDKLSKDDIAFLLCVTLFTLCFIAYQFRRHK